MSAVRSRHRLPPAHRRASSTRWRASGAWPGGARAGSRRYGRDQNLANLYFERRWPQILSMSCYARSLAPVTPAITVAPKLPWSPILPMLTASCLRPHRSALTTDGPSSAIGVATVSRALAANSPPCYVMLPGMKHLISMFWPSNLTGQTIVLPNRFGSVITASSGTSIHAPSRRTR
jgi:hypothetical protein